MILALRSDKPEAELYLFDDGKKIAEIKWEAHRELADTILGKIKEILVNNDAFKFQHYFSSQNLL